MKSIPIEIIRQALNHEPPERVPIIPLVGLYSVNLTKSGIFELLHSADKQTKALLHALKMFEYDGVSTCMDLTVEAQVLGADIVFKEDTFPYVRTHPYSSGAEIEKLQMPLVDDSRLGVFVGTTKKLVEAVGDTHLVSSYLIGPFTLAGHLMGVDTLLALTIEEPERAISIIEACKTLITPYLEALVEAGAHNIIILEPTASSNIISPRFFEKFAMPSISRLNQHIRSMGLLSTLHICGNTTKILEKMATTGADALSIDAAVDMSAAKTVTKGKVTLIGNVDTSVMLTGTPQTVKAKTLKCIRESRTLEGGHIVSTGCDIPIETPKENIQALVAAAKEYSP